MLVLVLVSVLSLTAQNSSQVVLNIKLYPIQSISVTGNSDVDLIYKEKKDYKEGVSVNKPDHLSVFSTGGFEVSMKSETPNLLGDENSIGLSDITVRVSKGSNPIKGDFTRTRTNLSESDQVVISNNRGGVDKTFDVEYSAKGNNKYLDLYNYPEDATSFTTLVTYSIIAK